MELLTVYKASAGSGKTFTLTTEYIKHLILNPHAYQQILAVTFTNKATTEMKERILQQLYGIWRKVNTSEVYLKYIESQLNNEGEWTEEQIRQRAGIALQYILHDYGRFRIETIDSFFQSVMRNLARELGLNPNLNIELNNIDVLNKSVDSLIEKLTLTSPVLAWILEYINERIANDKRWNVSNEIKAFGLNILDEKYIEQGEALRKKMRNPEVVKLYRELLHKMEAAALKDIQYFWVQFENILKEHALTPDDFKNGAKGIGSYFKKLRDGRLADKDVKNATLNNCMADAQNWVSKTSVRKTDIIQLAETRLIPLLKEAETQRPQKLRTINSCRLSLKHLNKLQLLNHIDEEMRLLNHEQNRFLLSDTNALLHSLLQNGDSSFIFEKIGANIHHVMIDEFQDTSRMQWDNFRILLLEELSQGFDNLIVGDVKQSIYRWRNGDWNILNNLKEDPSQQQPINRYVKVKTLRTNRRSEANVIDFNNRLFKKAVEYLDSIYQQDIGEECSALKDAYADIIQESPKNELQGYVKGMLLNVPNGEDYTACTLQALGSEVLHLINEGVNPNDITILVRKNKNIPPIAEYFDKELRLTIVSDEAFRLDASSAVCTLMDAIRYLSNPDDGVSATSLATNYLIDIKKSTTSWKDILENDIEDLLPVSFTSRMEELKLMPLYELFEELLGIFDLTDLQGQDAYLFSFFDNVMEYLKNNSSELDAFINYWDETLCSKTIPSNEVDGIRIMSIHKSKGLEFHTVLIPFCDWKLENETNNQLVWCTPQEPPYNQLDLVPVNYSSTMIESVYRKDYEDERLQLWVDNLNLLYVAFTRAEKNLIFWSKNAQKGSISELFTTILPQMALSDDCTWEENEETSYFEKGQIIPSKIREEKIEKDENGNKLLQQTNKYPVCMQSIHHDVNFRQSNRSADFIAGNDEQESPQQFIDRGRMLHTLFSSIRVISDVDNAIDQLVFEGIIGNKDKEYEIRQFVKEAFSHPQVQDWYSGKWTLFNECDIIWQENGELHTRRPDRVMTNGEEMIVVDFKFGKVNARYNKQVQEYIRLLERMIDTPRHISGFLWYVDEKIVERVKDT